MLLGAVVDKFEWCKFIICVIGIEFVYVVLVYLSRINECNTECVFDPLMDVVMIFGGDGVWVLFLFRHFVYIIRDINFYGILCVFG